MQLDKPNLTLPLVPSYNERGIGGFTNTITNGIDQRRVNCIYRLARNAMTGKETVYLSRRPGVTIDSSSYGTSGQSGFLVTTTNTVSAGTPVQKAWVFSTSGNDVRVSDSSGTTTILTSAGRVPIFVSKTLVSGAEYVVLQMRTTLGNTQRVFYAASSDRTTWTEITDVDFTGLSLFGKMAFMDGFAFIMDGNSRIYNSDLNSLSSWAATNYIAKQIQSDGTGGLAQLGNQIIAFGAETMEVFYNAGNATASPLEAVKQKMQRCGVYVSGGSFAYDYYATVGRRIYFRGIRSPGSGVGNYGVGLFAYDGDRIEKISTPFIDAIVNDGVASGNAIVNVQAASFAGMEAIAFALDLPAATTQRWLMFFPDWNEWFEWNSTVFAPIVSNNAWLGVGSNQHRLYTISNTDNWQDNGANYTRTIQFKLPKDGNHRKFMRMCGIEGDTARSAQSLNVEFSDDDDQTFQTARAIDRTSDKPHLYRCGSFRTRTVRLSDSGNFEGRLENFLARID